MKKTISIITIFFLIALCLCLGFSSYVNKNVKKVLVELLQSNVHSDVSIAYVKYKFPFQIYAVDASLAGKLQIKEIYAFLKPSSFFDKENITFKTIQFIEPTLTIYKTKSLQERVVSVDENVKKLEKKLDKKVVKNKKSQSKRNLVIDQILVKEGKIDYVNQLSEKEFSILLEAVYLRMNEIAFPLVKKSLNFTLTAQLKQDRLPITASQVKAEGWINYLAKDLDANISIFETDGEASFTAKAVSRNNAMKVEGKVKLDHLIELENDVKINSIDSVLHTVLNETNLVVGADFSFETKMDDFRFSKVSFSGSLLSE
jgi:hypothetical protein